MPPRKSLLWETVISYLLIVYWVPGTLAFHQQNLLILGIKKYFPVRRFRKVRDPQHKADCRLHTQPNIQTLEAKGAQTLLVGGPTTCNAFDLNFLCVWTFSLKLYRGLALLVWGMTITNDKYLVQCSGRSGESCVAGATAVC